MAGPAAHGVGGGAAAAHDDATLAQPGARWEAEPGVRVRRPTMARVIRRLGITVTKSVADE